VELVKGANIASLPKPDPLPDTFEIPILLKVGDDISTDEIMPAGARVLPYRSNIPQISEFVYEIVDPTYTQRALASKAQGGHVIVGGENYGQGSGARRAGAALFRAAAGHCQGLCPHPSQEPDQLRHSIAGLRWFICLRKIGKRRCDSYIGFTKTNCGKGKSGSASPPEGFDFHRQPKPDAPHAQGVALRRVDELVEKQLTTMAARGVKIF